jgi:hypothetical protein
MGSSTCQIRITSDEPRIRFEGDFVPYFYDRLKEIIPKERRHSRCEKYTAVDRKGRLREKSKWTWFVDKELFYKVMELAYEYFDSIQLFENGRADIFYPKKSQGA